MMAHLWVLFLIVPFAAAGYSQSTADDYAKLSGAAYCSTSSLANWNCGPKCSASVSSVKVCKGHTTRAYVGDWSGKCLLVFEGTSNVKSFIQDLRFYKQSTNWDKCNNCKVHSGFLNEWKSLQSCVETSLSQINCGAGKQLHVSGHSLGAALSGLAMMSLNKDGWNIAESYNFGMPRTGDESFAKEFNSLFGNRFHRITHHEDPVVQVPPDQLILNWHFEHVEPEVFYNGDVSKGYTQCSVADDKKCSEQYWNVPIDLLHLEDHLDYMGEQTSSFGCQGETLNTTVAIVV